MTCSPCVLCLNEHSHPFIESAFVYYPCTRLMSVQFSSVQSLSRVWLFATPWIAACQASLSITNSRSSLRLTSIESVMPSSHLILCRPLLLLPPIPPSIPVFSNESALRMRWPKYKFNINSHIPIFILLNQQNQPRLSSCNIAFPWHPWHNALLISSYLIVHFFVSSDNGVALNFFLVLNDSYPIFTRPSHLSLQILCASTWFYLQGCYPCTSYYHS